MTYRSDYGDFLNQDISEMARKSLAMERAVAAQRPWHRAWWLPMVADPFDSDLEVLTENMEVTGASWCVLEILVWHKHWRWWKQRWAWYKKDRLWRGHATLPRR